MGSPAVAHPELLVVEDDKEILTVVQDTLEEEGCVVTSAASLRASLALLSDHAYHLVLTSWQRTQASAPEPPSPALSLSTLP